MDDELDDELSIGVFIASYHFLYITDFFIVAVAPNPGTRNITSIRSVDQQRNSQPKTLTSLCNRVRWGW